MRFACERSRSISVGRILLAAIYLSGGVEVGAIAAAFEDSVERYRSYLAEDVESALAGARQLRERAIANDLPGAKQWWIDARVGWERSEVFPDGFRTTAPVAVDRT